MNSLKWVTQHPRLPFYVEFIEMSYSTSPLLILRSFIVSYGIISNIYSAEVLKMRLIVKYLTSTKYQPQQVTKKHSTKKGPYLGPFIVYLIGVNYSNHI